MAEKQPPKEKAKELFEKFLNVFEESNPISFNEDREPFETEAKQCAIVCVEDEIQLLHKVDKGYDMVIHIEYLQSVKEEIAKL